MAKRELADWIPGWMYAKEGGSKSLCLHLFTKPSNGLRSGSPFEILTVASREKDGRLALREVRVSALGTHNIQPPDADSLVPDTSRRAWAEDLLKSMYSKTEIDPRSLQDYLSTAVIRKVLTGHIAALHFSPEFKKRQLDKRLKPSQREKSAPSFLHKGESLTKATARIYLDFVNWGETKAAAVFAECEGVSVTTIHNRLQQARSSKYLDTPGKGARRIQ